MKKVRTFNTLFMLSSVDGKISTGDVNPRDVDSDFVKIDGLKEGLPQYYALEKQTDLHSFNTGRVMAKVGMNKVQKKIVKLPVHFIIVDNSHLTLTGVKNLLRRCTTLYLVTSNKKHPAFGVEDTHLRILYYSKQVRFSHLFSQLKKKYAVGKVTIQSGSTINSVLLREGLIDRISLVVAPALIGGDKTASLIGGKSLRTDFDLKKIKTLKLVSCSVLKNSYLHLVYTVN